MPSSNIMDSDPFFFDVDSPVNGRVGVFWDWENCPPPSGMNGYTIADKIREAALAYGRIDVNRTYLELSAGSPTVTLRSELRSSGIEMMDCPHNGGKDVVDKTILVDMLTFAYERPEPATILLISGDRDFAYALSTLRNRQHRVVLLSRPTAVHESLRSPANEILSWNTVFGLDSQGHAPPPSLLIDLHWREALGLHSSSESSVWQTPPSTASGLELNIQPRSSSLFPLLSSVPPAKCRPTVDGHASASPPTASVLPDTGLGSTTVISGQIQVPLPAIGNVPASSPTFTTFSDTFNQHGMTRPAVSVARSTSISFALSSNEPQTSAVTNITPEFKYIPPEFEDLVGVLEYMRLHGQPKPLRTFLALRLLKRDPNVYSRAGAKRLKAYLGKATTFVDLHESGLMASVSLKPEYHGQVRAIQVAI